MPELAELPVPRCYFSFRSPYSWLAHQELMIRHRAPALRGHDFIEGAFRARFVSGRDLCDRATVADIAYELGLDPRELARASDVPALRSHAIAGLLQACDDGVFSVPFFVHGTRRCFGLDRLDAFVDLLTDQVSDRHQPAVSAGFRPSRPSRP
ncbi:DsbA family protein [Streptomyces lasiicapitis]|uniref:DsbA family protein n=1 Tax=Streptomyces lasiicapitis TaxID=1923961 RepID=UPI00332D525D